MEPSPRKLVSLKRSGDFRRVRESGSSFSGKWLVLGVWRAQAKVDGRDTTVAPSASAKDPTKLSSELQSPEGVRFGLVTSRKVGGAVVRNKVRRRLRHIQREHQSKIRENVWCVTVARFRAAQASFKELEEEWCKLAKRAGVLPR
jgi:ribonuclease P protein component